MIEIVHVQENLIIMQDSKASKDRAMTRNVEALSLTYPCGVLPWCCLRAPIIPVAFLTQGDGSFRSLHYVMKHI